jgi:hypothetical protein
MRLAGRFAAAIGIAAIIIVALAGGCAIETRSLGIQKGCEHVGGKSATEERVQQYYGMDRKPDKVVAMTDGRTEIYYYTPLYGQKDSRHWSGYVVYFAIFPVLPLLIPDGHYGQSYVIRGGMVQECTNYWDKFEGRPTLHI